MKFSIDDVEVVRSFGFLENRRVYYFTHKPTGETHSVEWDSTRDTPQGFREKAFETLRQKVELKSRGDV